MTKTILCCTLVMSKVLKPIFKLITMKNLIASALLFSGSLFAQENFHSEFNFFGHNYTAVVNKGLFAKWVLDEEKSFYLAPDSTTSELMTVIQWTSHRQQLKSKGFNEIDSRYYWNHNTKTVVMLLKDPHERTGLLHVSTEYGTNIQ